MGELEKYGVLSAALLLLMAGLLAFFGRDPDDDQGGARALSAATRELGVDPGAPPREVQRPRSDGFEPGAPRNNAANPGPSALEPRPRADPTPPSTPAEDQGGQGAAPSTKPVATPPAAPKAPEGPTTYRVQAGDTLSAIALRHFGDKKHYPLIEAANPGVDSRSLRIGQELVLPPKSAIHGDATTTPGATQKPDANAAKKSDATAQKPKAGSAPRDAKQPAAKAPREHRVVKGDTLTSIARRYYADPNRWKDIFEANRDRLKSTSVLPVGVVLEIP